MSPGAAVPGSVLLTLALSGCFLFGHCGPYYEDATWTEPGLFEALGERIAVDTDPTPGFPFRHPEAEARWGPYYVVSRVLFGPEHHDRETLNIVLEAGTAERDVIDVTVRSDETFDDAAWRGMLWPFVNATGVAGDDPRTWIDSLLATRSVQGEVWHSEDDTPTEIQAGSLVVAREPNLTALAARLGAPDLQNDRPGHPSLRWDTGNGTWTFHLRLATRTIQIESSTPGELETLTVTANDQVTVTVQQDIGGNETAVQEWLRTRFVENDLPAPTFEGFWVSAVVC